MKRLAFIVPLAMLVVAPILAQAPEGWMVRADKSTNASDPDAAGDIKFMSMGSDLHAVNPQAAVYWQPANTASGTYTLKGTFKLVEPSGHNNYYGLVLGGSALDGPDQNYLYFLVAQDGSWLVKRRTGDATTEDVAPKMASDAVQKPGADGTSVNALEVRVMADSIEFAVNGTTVHTAPKSGMTADTDGSYGIRVNHRLEVVVSDFGVS